MRIFYLTDDGQSQIQLRAKDQSAWLTQREMAGLEEGSVTEESSVTAADGKNYLTHALQPRPHYGRRLPSAIKTLIVTPLATQLTQLKIVVPVARQLREKHHDICQRI